MTYTTVLHAGLGNQLFQLFSIYGLAKKHNKSFYISSKLYGGNKHANSYFHLFNHFHNPYLTFTGFIRINEEEEFEIQNIDQYKDLDCVFFGFFQNINYFHDYYFDINKHLLKIFNKSLIHNIDEYTAIHFRTGDNTPCNKKHYINLNNYYLNAIDHIPDTEKIILFSDNMTQARIEYEIVFKKLENKFKDIKEITDMNEVQTLSNMCRCKSIVMSNSTFAWWASYINHHKKTLIIQPSKLLNGPNEHKSMQKIPSSIVLNV